MGLEQKRQPPGRGRSAVVGPTQAAEHISIGRASPPASLVPFVDYYWWVRWSCPEPYEQQVIPQPCVHVTAELHDGVPRLLVTGIMRKPFVRRLHGDGHVIGSAFRPASFRAVLGRDVAELTDRVVALGDLIAVDDRPVAADALSGDLDDGALAELMTAWWSGLDLDDDPVAADLNMLLASAEFDRAMVRAEQLADLAGVALRTLQRQFAAYLGIGPKWVVHRFRLLDAAAAAHSGEPVDWAALAVDLGFSDQAHLTRAFRDVVGRPPATYARDA